MALKSLYFFTTGYIIEVGCPSQPVHTLFERAVYQGLPLLFTSIFLHAQEVVNVHATEPAALEADMHPYSSSNTFGSNEFWAGVAERVEPLLGDVEVTLGRLWMDMVESCFTRSDFYAIEVARRSGGKPPQWHVLEWHSGASSISRDDDFILAGETQAECVAHLVSKCTYEGVWPSSVSYRDDGQTLEFGWRREIFAIIRVAAPPQAITGRLRARVDGTLLGLEKANDPQLELTKRLTSWPGLSTVSSAKDNWTTSGCHWPAPSEWLIASRRLWAAAGHSEIGLASAQELASAVFGFKSWNHLCGLLPSTASKSDWWSMCAPYYVGDGVSDISTTVVYQDVADAFFEFRSRVADACANSKTVDIRYDASLAKLPMLSALDTSERPSLESVFGLEPTLAHMHPVEHVMLGEELLDRVRSALENDGEAGLRALLMIDASVESKLARRISETGMKPLITDGPWYFFVTENRWLVVELMREDGTKIGMATVPIHKSEISWSISANGFVLTSDYNLRRPVAIMRGLADATVQKLRSLLVSDSPQIESFDERMRVAEQFGNAAFLRDDVSSFSRMIKGITAAGTVLSIDS